MGRPSPTRRIPDGWSVRWRFWSRAGRFRQGGGRGNVRVWWPSRGRARCATQAIGYAEAFAVLDGTLTEAAARERTVVRTRQLARRQETYLRHQFDVDWVQAAPGDAVETLAGRVAEKWGMPWAK